MIIEACVENLEEALHAEKNGADQVELCTELKHGGLTPDINLVRNAVQELNIPVKVMIRPRPGNFTYTAGEIRCMEESIELMKQEAVGGLVLGLLKKSGEVDRENTARLISKAGSLPVTFHRAVDETPDPLRSVRMIAEAGASFLLTSGKAPTAIQGAALINDMQEQAGNDLTLIAAGGITVHNLLYVKQSIQVRAFHGTGIVGRTNGSISWRTI